MPEDDQQDSSQNSNTNTNTNTTTTNPFVRFKHHVDARIHTGINAIASVSRGNTSSESSPPPTPTLPPPSDSNPCSTAPSAPSPFSNTPQTMTAPTPTPTPPPSSSSSPTLSFLTPSDAHLESRLALLTGSTLPEANLAWSLFLSRSAYSPLRLHHANSFPSHPHHHHSYSDSDSLYGDRDGYGYGNGDGAGAELTLHPGLGARPPTPRDLPPDCADARFGWLEAFEDLLRAESGLPLMDLRARAREEREARRWWGSSSAFGWLGFGTGLRGMGLKEELWLGRLERDGLSEVLFPVWDRAAGYASPRSMGEWAERRRWERREEEEAGRLWEGIVGAATRGVEEGWRELDEARREVERGVDEWAEERKREAKREVDEWRDAGHDKVNGFFDGIGGVVRTLGKVLEDEVKSLQRLGKGRDKDEKAGDKDTDKDTPQTENDLYSVIQSAFHDSERSLSNFFKSLSEGWRDDARAEPKPASTPKIETTERVENGITKKTTKTEYVDALGNAHTKSETTWTDEDGRVVMRQVHSSMGRSAHWEKTFETGSTTPSQDNKEPAEEPEREHKKEGGWFWK